MSYLTLLKFTKSYQNKKIIILISLFAIILLGYCFVMESGDMEYFYTPNVLDYCSDEYLEYCADHSSIICSQLINYYC